MGSKKMTKVIETKICTKCGKELLSTAEYFQRNTRNKSGFRSECKKCTRKYYGRKNDLKYRYNISQKEYNQMLNKQDGKCIICGELPTTFKNLSVDHNHKTGKIRGLLCDHCNRGIGFLKENPYILIKAIKYLK